MNTLFFAGIYEFERVGDNFKIFFDIFQESLAFESNYFFDKSFVEFAWRKNVSKEINGFAGDFVLKIRLFKVDTPFGENFLVELESGVFGIYYNAIKVEDN